jgi:sulfate permease, SulP family
MGIAVVIAMLQLKDLLGLDAIFLPPHFVSKLGALLQAVPDFSASTVFVGLVTLVILWLWPRLNTSIPGHLPAVLVGSSLAFVLIHVGHPVATVASTFHYLSADGAWLVGIPALLPDLQWPWARVQPGESPLIFDWQVAQDLLSAAFAIAMLGAIESLLCAVVLDGLSGHKHSANSELLGQGIGNIITPFFGGITATAAIARSATNFRAGAHSPIAAMMHAVVVLMALMVFTRVLGHLPMASMAALLIMVAWNMSDAPKALRLLKTAPVSDVLVFVVCFSLTVLFDMVIAISTGIVLASLLFMKQMADMTKVQDITHNQKMVDEPVPEGWKIYKINGPLFFAAADRVFAELSILSRHQSGIILSLDGVSILDAGGVSALQGFIKSCAGHRTQLYLVDFQYQPLKTLARARFLPDGQVCTLYSTLADALQTLPNEGMPVAHGVS